MGLVERVLVVALETGAGEPLRVDVRVTARAVLINAEEGFAARHRLEAGERELLRRRVAVRTGQLIVRPLEEVLDVGVLEGSFGLGTPTDLVHEMEIEPVVLGVAVRTLRAATRLEEAVVAGVVVELRLDLLVAAETATVDPVRGVAGLAAVERTQTGDLVVRVREGPGASRHVNQDPTEHEDQGRPGPDRRVGVEEELLLHDSPPNRSASQTWNAMLTKRVIANQRWKNRQAMIRRRSSWERISH